VGLSSESNTLLSLEGLSGLKEAHIAIVSTEWNDAIVSEQLIGARFILNSIGINRISEYVVPGAFEIPFACRQLGLNNKSIDAIITFGAVIRGGTPHFEYVCKALVEGIASLNVTLDIPVIFGVLTLENEIQAWERLGGIHGHKGQEAAIAALKMIRFKKAISNI
jgi:6,7-dimethyl-8-ribityllumazine synthase